MCLHGCPYGLIFNAGDVVDRLRASPRFVYRAGRFATRFEEGADSVRLWTRSADGTVDELRGERLFVAAGVLPTALLVLDSLAREGRALTLRDSRHFFVPMLQRWRADPDPATEPRHTLAQVFVEIADPRLTPNTVHVQIYTHNDGFASDLRKRFGALAGALEPMIATLSRRLIVAQAFLHSDVSPPLEVTMRRVGGRAQLELAAKDATAFGPVLARVKRRVAEIARRVDLLPLTPFAHAGAPGASFHCGGTFPMRERPRDLETDVLGRLAGLSRIHLVDASVFPSIPATTITFSAMANAHRIATEALALGS
jgi:choline dehydrogenase-like flavoprotein